MSLKLPIVIKASAPEKPEDINDFIQELIFMIKNNFSLDKTTELNIKLVLVELITNSIKHVKGYDSLIEVHLDDPIIQISKIDNASRFVFSERNLNNKLNNSNYSVEIIDENTLQFKNVNLRSEDDLSSFPENYGFEIITKASQQFFYKYDSDNSTNLFIAIIKS